ncbi:MAG: alanine dehydrogenase, partial [Macellibacteroides fermentans]|uniref:alanine dehydrogenase n=1 Tax=Macellibacteroides fermentans TaxID=879969 RepID=UPI003B6FD693
MIIGVPKEIKNNENRVGLTPAGVKEIIMRGHQVYVQQSAGLNSGFPDEAYLSAGANLLPTIEEVYAVAEMIVKVKEPIASEYPLIRENQLLFTYFHFASDENLTKAMIASKAVCLAYETVEKPDGSLPLLIPMSEVAGRMATQEGTRFLEKHQGGKGILLGGVPGVKPAKVLVLGGGIVGFNAAKMAAGLGAEVIIADISLPRLRWLNENLPANVKTLYSSSHNIEGELHDTDLVIGAVLIPGAKAPYVLTKEMIPLLKKGSVLVDVAIDQGGCFETSHATTHANPVYEINGVIHYCVANIPG